MNTASMVAFGFLFGIIFGFCEEMWKKITLIVFISFIAIFFITISIFDGGQFISDNPNWWGLGFEMIGVWIGMMYGNVIGKEVKE